MHRKGQCVAYAEHGAKRVGARTQMRLLAQELHGMTLFLQRITGVGGAVHLYLIGLQLNGLAFALALGKSALCVDGRTRGDELQKLLLTAEAAHVEHYLQVLDGGAVVEGYELNVLVASARTHPALYIDLLTCICCRVCKQTFYGNSLYIFHCCVAYSNDPWRR